MRESGKSYLERGRENPRESHRPTQSLSRKKKDDNHRVKDKNTTSRDSKKGHNEGGGRKGAQGKGTLSPKSSNERLQKRPKTGVSNTKKGAKNENPKPWGGKIKPKGGVT